MFEALENRVTDLHRSSFGGLTLGDLAPGQYKFLSGAEVSALILERFPKEMSGIEDFGDEFRQRSSAGGGPPGRDNN